MRKRKLAIIMAAAVTISAIAGACSTGEQKTEPQKTESQSTESQNTYVKDGETTAEGTAQNNNQGNSGSESDKNYNNTYDVAGAGEVKLDVMITSLGDSDGGPYLRSVMDNYMNMYPNVTLNPVECSMNDLYTTLITQATAGTLPDIFTMTEAYSANCAEMEMNISNLDQLLGEEYLNGLMEVAIENATVDGQLVYMPWQNNITAMVYRKDLFEEKGIDIPKTWDEFLEAAKLLTEDIDGDGRIDRYGAAFAGTRNDSAESRFQTFALTFGSDFITANGDGTYTSGFGTEQFKNAMTSFINLAAKEEIAPPGFIETGYSEAYTMIAADQACMFFSASNVLGGIYNANPELRGKMGSFPMPTANGVDPVTSFSSVGMTISNTCKNPEVAADFLKYMTSVENTVEWNEATCRLPVVKEALDAICENDSAYTGFAESSDSAVIYPAFAGLAELRDICGECWQTVVSEGVSIDDAIATAATKAEEAAKSYSN